MKDVIETWRSETKRRLKARTIFYALKGREYRLTARVMDARTTDPKWR